MKEIKEMPRIPKGPELPNVDGLSRRLRYHRAKILPPNPGKKDLFFPVDESFFPQDWYQGEIVVGPPSDRARHLLFFTPTMKRMLEDCRCWFMDGTFFLPVEPFKQLFTINGFLKNEKKEVKQVPLLFCLMTRRRAVDYVALFNKILSLLTNLPKVERIITDFERAVFSAVRTVFPGVHHLGCNFHHEQSLFKNVKELGFSPDYSRKGENPIRDYIQKLMCLCYLPGRKIKNAFYHLKGSAPEELAPMVDYMETNWIESKVWTPENWSCFMLFVRSNNDQEGLHNLWNKIGKAAKLPFYRLTEVLHEIAEEIPLTATLLCSMRLVQTHRFLLKHDFIRRKQDALLDNVWFCGSAREDRQQSCTN